MEFLQERDVEDGKTGAHPEPEGHGHEAEADDDPAVIELVALAIHSGVQKVFIYQNIQLDK
jgi:hypothetical protein